MNTEKPAPETRDGAAAHRKPGPRIPVLIAAALNDAQPSSGDSRSASISARTAAALVAGRDRAPPARFR